MNRSKNTPKLLLLLLGGVPLALAAPSFTGNVDADFDASVAPTAVIVDDPGGVDVGIPTAAPGGTISGNDMDYMALDYDPGTDTLYVGIATYTIAGDVDDDGDGSTTSSWLSGIGGMDEPDFAESESFAVMIDLDEDGIFDLITGVSGLTDAAGFDAAEFDGSVYAPAYAFGASLPDHLGTFHGVPDASAPHLEFTIESFSTIPLSSGADSAESFAVAAYIGSFSDAGVGEDHIPGVATTTQICFDIDLDGWTACEDDCDDSDPAVNPGAFEDCDGLDNDCDGFLLPEEESDTDGDSLVDCADNEECDGLDNDGDGNVDEDLPDSDGDGTCDELDDEECDGIDNDGDGTVDEGYDADGDGLGDCFETEDCDGLDNDGDGSVDEDTSDSDGDGLCDELDGET